MSSCHLPQLSQVMRVRYSAVKANSGRPCSIAVTKCPEICFISVRPTLLCAASNKGQQNTAANPNVNCGGCGSVWVQQIDEGGQTESERPAACVSRELLNVRRYALRTHSNTTWWHTPPSRANGMTSQLNNRREESFLRS